MIQNLSKLLQASKAILLLVLVLAVAAPLTAQLTTGTLLGSVTDTTGAAIPGAKVTLTQTGTNFMRVSETNGTGAYSAEFLPVGTYTVKVEAPGFSQALQKGIVLAATQHIELNYKLDVGMTDQTVTVTEEQPLINLSNSVLGSEIDNREIDNLPLVGRDAYQLLTLTPGVQKVLQENSIGLPMEHVIINGSSDNMVGQVSYYLDGNINMTGVRATGNVIPNPDALDQFSVQTSNFSAEYGRTGAGVVSVLTKSGTNELHGSIFEFHQETNFTSDSYLQQIRSPLHKNQFGATIGGPIMRDKIFLFASYGGLRQISPLNYNTVVPDAFQRVGDFHENFPTNTPNASGSCTTAISAADKALTDHGGRFWVCDPVTHLVVANGHLDTDPNFHIDPVATAVLNQNVVSPTDTVANRYVGSTGLANTTNEYLIKGDFQLIPKHRVTLSYFQSIGSNITNPSGLNLPNWALSNYEYRQQNGSISDVWSINPTTANQLWISLSRMIAGRVSTPAKSLADYGSALNVQGVPSLPDINVAGFFHLANAISGPLAGDTIYGGRDVYSKTIGHHTLNFGAEAYLEKDRLETLLNNYGTFSFTSNVTTNGRTGAAISDFLEGHPQTMGQDSPDDANENYWNYGFFAQDDWRILSNLTLNLGVRYDVQTSPTDTQRRIAVFEPGVQSTVSPNAMLGQLFPGDPGVPAGGAATNYNHVSPRLGFSFDPFKNGKTVFHGGAGIFFDTVAGNEWMLSQNFQPFAVRETAAWTHVTSLTSPYATDPTDFAGGLSPFPYLYDKANPRYVSPASLVFIQKGLRWPYNYQANFGVQQQFSNDLALSINYVGAFSRKIPLMIDKNAPIYDPANPANNLTGNVNCRRPYDAIPKATATTCAAPAVGSKYMSNAYVVEGGQTTNYNGLQVTVDKRLSRHVSLKSFYIWSKGLSSASLQTTGNIGNSAATEPEDYQNLRLERQRTDNDMREQFSASIIWKPDYFTHFNPVVRTLLNGWSISTIVRLHSGMPFNITSGTDDNQDGDTNDRPNVIAGQRAGLIPYTRNVATATSQRWFNIGAYCKSATTCPGTGTGNVDGTVRVNSLDAPGYRNVDASLFRDFTIYHNWKFQFRGEATNVFNMVSLNAPGGTFNSASSFGVITGASPMRQLQVGGRLLF